MSRTVYRQSSANTRRRAQVVGTDDIQERERGPARPSHLYTPRHNRLFPVEGFQAAQRRRPVRQQRLLRQQDSRLGLQEAAHLLVRFELIPPDLPCHDN